MLTGKNVILGVTGSIAAYKIANLASALRKLHCNVDVIMTKNATEFINPVTLRHLQGINVLLIHLTGILNIMLSMWHLQKRQMYFL